MTLRELLGAGGEVEITALAYDNRKVEPGTLFFCVPGFTRDGHDFAADAVQRGAAALVVQRPLGLGVPEVVVDDVRDAMARAAQAFSGDPSRRLQVVGITGTNGKTTTAYLVRAALEAGGVQCGLLGTVTSVIGGEERPTERTTPEAIELQATLAEMWSRGDRAAAIEVSSHALELKRAYGVRYAASVFTNLTQDHLDFHPDMESYFLAKRKLFTELDAGAAIVNVDDAYGRRLADELERVTTFAISSEADWRVTHLRTGLSGSDFVLWTPHHGEVPVSLPLPGRFNVLNAVAALAVATALTVDIEDAVRGLAEIRVPGRFEPVDEGQEFAVLVDYAHTPDSLENVLSAARELGSGRVIVVFGAGGDRDRGKRPQMGEIGARLADVAIVTSDNPRSEDPEAIVAEVAAGAGSSVTCEVERRAAIFAAVGMAAPGDVVVIAGKGHEQGQEFADGRKEPFDDVAVAREALRGRA
jgi:UDP-N-acetylmuramoyl-L-alanyl-D-glutamate--2,6-diaminopimelate ligase